MRDTPSNTARLPAGQTSNARNLADGKETTDRLMVVAFAVCDPEPDFYIPVEARFYRSRSADGASPIYCSVWIRTRDGRSFSGHGKAQGYGYHKASAALQFSLDSAGVKLARAIDGVGTSAMTDAMLAVADAAGYEGMPRTIR